MESEQHNILSNKANAQKVWETFVYESKYVLRWPDKAPWRTPETAAHDFALFWYHDQVQRYFTTQSLRCVVMAVVVGTMAILCLPLCLGAAGSRHSHVVASDMVVPTLSVLALVLLFAWSCLMAREKRQQLWWFTEPNGDLRTQLDAIVQQAEDAIQAAERRFWWCACLSVIAFVLSLITSMHVISKASPW